MISISYKLTPLFKVADRRLGRQRLFSWAAEAQNPTVDLILQKRFGKKY